MASGGGSVAQWRLVAVVRDYLARSSPALGTLHKDLPEVVKRAASPVHGVLKKQKAEESLHKIEDAVVKATQSSGEGRSELQKALQTVNAYIPLYFSQVKLNFAKPAALPKPAEKSVPKWRVKTNQVSKLSEFPQRRSTTQASLDARTRFLVKGLGEHLTEGGRLRRLQDLCTHLRMYPEAKGVAVKRGGIKRLLRLLERDTSGAVEAEAREALALLGHTDPVRGHGIRLLSIDGGGVRGLVALEVLRRVEREAGQPIHQLFDYICGVSTGAILAVLLGVHRLSIEDCETLYRQLSTQIFTQTTFKGATSLFMKNSYYDSDVWTEILKKHMGDSTLIETARNAGTPKLSIVATSANTNRIQAYLFRNYNLPYRVSSHYQGTSLPRLWEAVRASAAAPGYFSEFRVGDIILLDGGLFVNNPTAIAVHEAKQLWPDAALQCVLSVGTGRHEPIATTSEASINWGTRIRTILNSATDTEGVHTTMHDLLPGNVYYRFNPYLSDEIGLDEIKADRLAMMMEDTSLYLRKNKLKIGEVSEALLRGKNPVDKVKDWYQHQSIVWPTL